MGGHVVHAKKGARSAYRPINSKLCDSSAPASAVSALLGLYAFKKLYIADLDAIRGTGNNYTLIRQLHQRYPELHIWVDKGIRNTADLLEFYQWKTGYAVIGSESLYNSEIFGEAQKLIIRPTPILSLDYQDDRFLGPPALQSNPALWPKRVILMTLNRVGADQGPDFERLEHLRVVSPATELYAAGGIRGKDDLKILDSLGLKGALLASALHNGAIGAKTLSLFN